MIKRIYLIASIIVLGVFFGVGIFLAKYYSNPHWLNRMGAAMVAIEGFLLFFEFSIRKRLSDVATSETIKQRFKQNPRLQKVFEQSLRQNISSAETWVFAVIVFVMIVGQLLHGFGDLLISVDVTHSEHIEKQIESSNTESQMTPSRSP